MSIITPIKKQKSAVAELPLSPNLKIKRLPAGVAQGAYSLQHWAANRSAGFSGDYSWQLDAPLKRKKKKRTFHKRAKFKKIFPLKS